MLYGFIILIADNIYFYKNEKKEKSFRQKKGEI